MSKDWATSCAWLGVLQTVIVGLWLKCSVVATFETAVKAALLMGVIGWICGECWCDAFDEDRAKTKSL